MTDLNRSMFRAYDIRTPANRLTEDLAIRLSQAEARYFREVLGISKVLLAHDARSSGPHFLNLALEEYLRGGLDVILIPGVCSTSKFYFAGMLHPDCAGVLIGASHNPAGDTGRKTIGPGVRSIARRIGPAGGLDCIEQFYVEDSRASGSPGGRLFIEDPTELYIDYSLHLSGTESGQLKGVRVVHDYLNGAAGPEMIPAFQRAGADIVPLHAAPDGSFPLGDPNPVKQEVIREGRETLASSGALVGMFFDGDGDRMDCCFGDGRYLSSSFVYAALLPEILRQHPAPRPAAFACLKSNPLALMEMAHAGVQLSVNRNGHSQIKESMHQHPELIGGVEESAHFYQRFHFRGGEYCTENTLYFALLTARVWSEDPARMERLSEIQSLVHREREWGCRFPSDDQRAAALAEVASHFKSLGAASTDRTTWGEELEASLLRRGLPFVIDSHTEMETDWLQVCQRVSQSEDGLARWEVVAENPATAREAKECILRIAAHHGGGEEYQG